MNQAILIGNVGQEPDVKYLDNGKPVATFSLATSKSWTDKHGVKQTKTEWHNIVAWDKRAQTIEKYLRKGMKLAVVGEIETRTWEDKNTGAKKNRTEIIASEITFLSWPAEAGAKDQYPVIQDEATPPDAVPPIAPPDDLPF